MADSNAYSRRLRSHRHFDSASSEEDEELEHVSRSGSRRYGVYTPEPVQRTLVLRTGEEEDEEDSEFEDLDDYSGVVYRNTTYRPPRVNENGEDVQEDEDVEDQEAIEHQLRHSELKRRMEETVYNKRPKNTNGVWEKIVDSNGAKKMMKYIRRLWRFLLRNSFVVVNVLWLLAPLCCFVIALTVPQYLTSTFDYVDLLSAKVLGVRESTDAGYEKGAMRSIVQEIVDMKLVGMNEEIGLLRQTVQSQERELEALKLLHDTLRHSHDEAQQKLRLAESNSAISVYIEKVVANQTQELWKKFLDSTSRLQQDLRTATKQQSMLTTVMKEQEEKMDAMQNIVKNVASAPRTNVEDSYERARDIRKDFTDWRDSFEREMLSEIQRKFERFSSHISRVLQTEKDTFSASIDALRGLDATDPGILRVVEVAVQAVEIKKTGRVDHAALANGASVIHSEYDLLYQDGSTWARMLKRIVGLSESDSDGRFTSPSYRQAPAPYFGQLLFSGDNHWWLSRHNGRPETALSETMEIGSCWGLDGSAGRLSVKFAQQIIADAITVDHIAAQIASDFRSAPKEFRIWGILGNPLRETVEFLPFGNFTYTSNGPASQTFKLTSSLSQHSAVDGITLEILFNHGHPDYTCLYRFRVHGQSV